VPPGTACLVAAQNMAEDAMLALVKRQLIDEINGCCLRAVQASQCLLSLGSIEGLLCAGDRRAAAERREDFAGVVHRLAPAESEAASQPMPVANSQFALQPVISRKRAVIAVSN